LLWKYNASFAIDTSVPGLSFAGVHEIDTKDSKPIKQRPYRTSQAENDIISEHVSKMEKANIIRKSNSPWSSPVVIVTKKDGTPRFCIDFRKVNAITTHDSYPLPRIDETLDALNGMVWFTTLDGASGYWQIPIVE